MAHAEYDFVNIGYNQVLITSGKVQRLANQWPCSGLRDCELGLSFRAHTVLANDAASAAKQFAAKHNLGSILLPLRSEKPVRIYTHNGETDYLADQWSGTTNLGFRIWIYS